MKSFLSHPGDPPFASLVFVRTIAPLVLGLVSLAIAPAEILLSDDFEGPGETDLVSSVDSKVLWEAAENRQLLGIRPDREGLNTGHALEVGNNLVFARIPTADLAVGQVLVLTLRFRSPDETPQVPAPLRIGLCDTRDENPVTGDTVGYWLHTAPGAAGKSGLSVEKNAESAIGGGNDGASLGATFSLNYDWRQPHLLTVKILRPSDSTIEVRARIDEGEEFVRTDAEGTVTQFNLVAFRLASTPRSRVFFDQVQLERRPLAQP